MPGWHEKTRKLEDQGRIQVVGIVQEQHAERTRLFMQWRGMDWPVMVDSLNLLGVSAVPITLLIDEYGVIRAIRPTDEDLDNFLLQQSTPAGDLVSRDRLLKNRAALLRALETGIGSDDADELRAHADVQYLWGDQLDPSRAIHLYRKSLELDPRSGESHFRLGVAYRKRYESPSRLSGDFTQAVKHWKEALEIDPNQYIWRRRIQQFGPRLDKPYSFYDWVLTARAEINARGETPISLRIEPAGAEYAVPAKDFQVADSERREPDPDGRIRRDTEGLVGVEAILVPHTSDAETAYRVHLVFSPVAEHRAHWNNEADDMEVWISVPKGWSASRQQLIYKVPPELVSQEERIFEFELRGPADFEGKASILTYALYYVCEEVDGTCLYRRKDISLELEKR